MKSKLRSCGECTLCCSIQNIEELNKPEGVKCRHCNNGCTIYEDRPTVCREFNCLWKFRKLFKDKKNRRRPDRLGALIIPKENILGYSPGLQFNSLTKDTFNKKDVKELIESFRKNGFNVATVTAGRNEESKLFLAKK
jgi:Fe-S-cluster containining protein